MKLIGAGCVALIGLGFVREALREAATSWRRLRTLSRLRGKVVAHERQARVLTGSSGSGAGRMHVRRCTVNMPVVEVDAPDGGSVRQRLGFGDENPGRHPIGSVIDVLWDPVAGEIVEKPGVGQALLILGALSVGVGLIGLGAWLLGAVRL